MERLPRRKFLCFAAGAAVQPALPPHAWAQSYPTRPVTIVVPYAPGGLFDRLARVLADHLRATLAQTVVIENVGGAGGSIAVGQVARATADGHTVAIGSDDQFVINAVVHSLQYDVVKDFEPVAAVANSPTLIVGRKNLPAGDLKELTAWLKHNHATVAFAHNGTAGLLHRCGLGLQRAAEASWPFVPYRGAAPALQDVIGGRIDVMCVAPATALAHARESLVRPYAVTATARLTAAPDIPTVDEAGFPDLRMSTWAGVFAPKGSPKYAIGRLHGALVEALADPEVRHKLTDLGMEIFPREQQTPDALAALQRADIEKWWPIIRAANIKSE